MQRVPEEVHIGPAYDNAERVLLWVFRWIRVRVLPDSGGLKIRWVSRPQLG